MPSREVWQGLQIPCQITTPREVQETPKISWHLGMEQSMYADSPRLPMGSHPIMSDTHRNLVKPIIPSLILYIFRTLIYLI